MSLRRNYLNPFLLLFALIAAHDVAAQSPIYDTIQVGPPFNHSREVMLRHLRNATRIIKYALENVGGPKRTFLVNGPITINVTATSVTCQFDHGSVMATASGGTPPYTYYLDAGITNNNGYFPSVGSGTYTLTVTDANGLTNSASVTIPYAYSVPSLVVGSFNNASSCIGTDASITLVASGGTPPYQYSMDMVNYQASNVFSNLSAGDYHFTVKDAKGCVFGYNSFSLGSFVAGCSFGLGFGYSGLVCHSEGMIDVTLFNAPNAPFTYSIDGTNYQTSPTITGLSPGIYRVYIKDNTGALISIFAVSIFRWCPLDITYLSTDADCHQNNGSLTMSTTNGAAPYSYSIDGTNYQTSNVFANLAAGTYSIYVIDGNGSSDVATATVSDRCPTLSLSVSNASCGQSDGIITAVAAKGMAPYTYSIDGINFQTNNAFQGLAPGKYTISLKDASGLTAKDSVVVGNSCINVTAISSNSLCSKPNGSLTVSVSNGTGPYQYSIDGTNFQTSNVFPGLIAGGYTVSVKDANGSTGTTTISVQDSPGPQISLVDLPPDCLDNDGSLTVTGTGGTSPLQFSIDGTNFQTANIFNNLSSGPYTAWIQDANGCVASKTIDLLKDCPTVILTSISETCHNQNGSIVATGVNGTSPYTFSINGLNFQTNPVFSGLQSGNYIVTVKDALGFINNSAISVGNICPVVTAVATDGLCGISNGTIQATGFNGTAPYQYSIDGVKFQTGNIFSGLSSNVYTVTLKDANGLTNFTTVAVNNFPAPQMSATVSNASCLNNDGKISIVASSGTLPYQYSIDGANFEAGSQFDNLPSGNHSVILKDAKGCTATSPVVIPLTDNLALVMNKDTTICEGGSAFLNPSSNGTMFRWSPPTGLNDTNRLTVTTSVVSTTKYYLSATLGACSTSDSVMVFVNPAPVAFAGNDTTICYGQSAQLNGAGGINYVWSPSTYLTNNRQKNPIAVKPSSTTIYSLTVTDVNHCQSILPSTVTIQVTPPAKVFAGNDTAITIGQPLQLYAKDVNNSGFVSYSWSPGFSLSNSSISNPILIGEKEMTYTVTATTLAGCQGSDDITIKVYQGPEIYVPTAFTPNGDGHNDVLRAIPVGIKEFKYFVVYNRWGQKVFYTTDASKGWDGKLGGVPQDTFSFVWITEGIDFKGNLIQRKGTVTLIR